MKKIFCQLVVLVVTISTFPAPMSAQSLGFDALPYPFIIDEEAITFVQDMGIMTGSEDGQFHPELSLTRCELVKVALLAGKVPLLTSPNAQQSFKDIAKNNWCYNYAATAKANNILSGYPDGSFKPNQPVTQIEALKILLNTLDAKLPTDLKQWWFKDVRTSDWWAPYVQYAIDEDIYLGSAHSNLSLEYGVHNAMTRKEAAFIIWKLLTDSLPRKAPNNVTSLQGRGDMINKEDVSLHASYAGAPILTTFQVLHYCLGKAVTTNRDSKKSCIGKNSLLIKTADNLYLLLDERDTTGGTRLPLFLGDPVDSVGGANVFIGLAYPSEYCNSEGVCPSTTPRENVNFLYFPSSRLFQKVNNYPVPARVTTTDPVSELIEWNYNSTKAIFVPQTCKTTSCTASTVMGYNRVTDKIEPVTRDSALADDPDNFSNAQAISTWWTGLRWLEKSTWRARLNTKGKESVTVQIGF